MTCGGLLILHGTHRLFHGMRHVRDIVTGQGLPEFIAYGNIAGEVIAPIFMIAGLRARIAALVIALNMLLSVIIAHREIVLLRNDFGGWMIELNVFYFMTALAVFFLGAGRYSLSGGKGKFD